MRYFANINKTGPVKYRDVPGSIAVLEAHHTHRPIGERTVNQCDAAGWRIDLEAIGAECWCSDRKASGTLLAIPLGSGTDFALAR